MYIYTHIKHHLQNHVMQGNKQMPFMCLEAWKTENMTPFEKRNLWVWGGDSWYDFLTAWMPQTYLPMLLLLAANHHSYTSSTAFLAICPEFLDTQKLSGNIHGCLYNACSAGPSASGFLGLLLHCKKQQEQKVKTKSSSGNPEQQYKSNSFCLDFKH